MSLSKKFISLFVVLIAPFVFAASTNAADETVSASTEVSPRSGSFYKEVGVASNLKIRTDVHTPVSSPLVMPMKNARVTFPAGTNLKPNNKKTPVCTDARLNRQSPLASPVTVVAACPRSVVGTGTSEIILAKVNNNPNTIKSAILVIFNYGTDNRGNAKVKIYGYSQATQVGILMTGTLVNRVLDVAVPVLSSDSAVRWFEFNLPGPLLDEPELGISVRGQDPNYVQARCATGILRTNATFQLGERDFSTGQPTSETVTAVAPESTQDCNGLAGRAQVRVPKANGPNAVKRGRVAVFRVTVRNPGTASAKNVVVRSNRGGKARAGKIAPRTAKTVRVKVRIKGKKNRRIAVRFIARSGNMKAAVVKRVRIR